MSTQSLSAVGISYALETLRDELKNLSLQGGTEKQIAFLNKLHRTGLKDIFGEQLIAKASRSADVLNAFFAENGISLIFEELKECQVGAASVLTASDFWSRPGSEGKIVYKGQPYPAVQFGSQAELKKTPTGTPVFTISSEKGDQVFVTPYSTELTGIDLVIKAMEIQQSCSPAQYDEFSDRLEDDAQLLFGDFRNKVDDKYVFHKGVIFPTIDYNQAFSLDWLLGLVVEPESRLYVQQAEQQNIIKLDHTQFFVKTGTKVVVGRNAGEAGVPLFINEPYLLWFTRPGCDVPYQVVWSDTDCWSQPEM